MQDLVKLLQSEIAADKDLLDQLWRSPYATVTDSVSGNLEALAASARSQRMIAEALSALVRLMEAQAEAALGFPGR